MENVEKRNLRQQSVDENEGPSLSIPSSSSVTRETSSSSKSKHYPKSPGILRKAFSLDDSHHDESYFEKQAEFSAITYLPLNTQIYRVFSSKQGEPPAVDIDTWFVMALIGLFTGFAGATLKYIVNEINEWKFRFVGNLVQEKSLGLTWFAFTAISAVFVVISTILVLYVHPQAAGSGIPEIICYLNGVSIRHVFTMKALLIKFLSCIFALAGGLYGGSEGPMIHMGAAIGKIVSQGVIYKFCGFEGELLLFERFKTMQHRRNFISAGCAAGIASAFFAPIGGLLFLFEEISSFYSKKLAWQTFFCCLIATQSTQCFLALYRRSNEDVESEWQVEAFQVDIIQELGLYIPTIIVGLVCGLFAAFFTWFLTKIMLPTKAHYLSTNKSYRIIEALVLAIITATGAILIPLLFSCQPCSDTGQGQYCTEASAFERAGNHTYQMYQCTEENTYNGAATLFINTADEEISYLFSRDTASAFTPAAITAMLLFYSLMCCLTIGSSPSLGTMVPALVIGSLIGRLCGLAIAEVDQKLFTVHHNWADPGIFALIGAAAFFGGLTRLTFSVAVIIIEITGETYLLVPTAISVMVGKWTADYLIESMYHQQIHLKCIPFLDDEPHVHGKNLDLHTVTEVMAENVICLKEVSSVAEVATILLSSRSHDAFPIVEETKDGDIYKGLVRRNHVYALLQKDELFMSSNDPLLSSGRRGSIDMNETTAIIASAHMSSLNEDDIKNIDDKIPQSMMQQTNRQRLERLQKLSDVKTYGSKYIALSPYIDSCSYSISTSFSIQRAHSLLRNMTLTHITVVNKYNHVVGILTRKDLLSDRINMALHAEPVINDENGGIELSSIQNEL